MADTNPAVPAEAALSEADLIGGAIIALADQAEDAMAALPAARDPALTLLASAFMLGRVLGRRRLPERAKAEAMRAVALGFLAGERGR